ALLRLVAEAFDPRTTPVREHLDIDVDPVDPGSAHLDVRAVAEQQDAAELDRRARLGGKPVDQDLVAWRHAVLLSAADDDSRQRTIRFGHERDSTKTLAQTGRHARA